MEIFDLLWALIINKKFYFYLDDKKDSNSKKSAKRKLSVSTENAIKKPVDDASKSKKHGKKHKEAKKAKKNKHKNKDKDKGKSKSGKKKKDDDESDKDSDSESSDGKSNGVPATLKPVDKSEKSDKKSKDKKNKPKKTSLNEAVGKAILGSLKDHERLRIEKNDGASKGSSAEKEVKGNGNGKELIFF